jgi:hypothetical protein
LAQNDGNQRKPMVETVLEMEYSGKGLGRLVTAKGVGDYETRCWTF